MKRRTPPRRIAAAPSRRRGVAMLLVIVALGTGVVLAGAYASSNSTAGTVGDNAASAVKATWSAKSASDIGVAILETGLDWRTAIADGTLISNQPIAGGNVTITFQNLNGDPPTPEDPEVIMTVKAVVNGVESTTQKLVRLFPDADVDVAIDNIVDEFTVFAGESLEVDGTSGVGVWSASPEANSSKIGKIGVGFADSSSFQLAVSAKIARIGAFAPGDASASLTTAIGHNRFSSSAKLPTKIPSPPRLMPSDFDGLTHITSDVDYDAKDVSLPSAYYQKLKLTNGSVGKIDAAFGTHYAFEDIEMSNGAVLAITGHVKIRIDDDLILSDRSAIELMTADSSLEIYIADSLVVDDSTVGFARAVAANTARSRNDPFKYRSPAAIKVFGVYRDESFEDDDEVPGQHVVIKNNALVIANIYAPFADVLIDNTGTLFGRASGRRMRVKSNSAILGDPSLDRGIGLTERFGPFYKENGDPIDGLADALASVNDAAGWEGVKSSLTSTLSSVTDPLKGALGGGSGAEAENTRKKGRAIAREWPMKAFAMEAKAKSQSEDEPEGSFLITKADDDDDFDDD